VTESPTVIRAKAPNDDTGSDIQATLPLTG
jgi:hypothetical protein